MGINLSVKKNVRKYWKRRLRRAREKLAELQTQREHQRYDLALAKQVLHQAQDKEQREYWQMQVEFLAWDVHQIKEQIAEEHSEIAHCQAILAAIRADLKAGE